MHCLISLNADQTLTKTIQLIKGEFSHWINTDSQSGSNFKWADEYYAVSVSLTQLNRVREYIRNQEVHHRNKSWEEESNEFMKAYRKFGQG
jgi:REP element-mobilizing transposase RayT